MGRGPTQEYYQKLNEDYVEGTLTCLKRETIERVINTDFPLILNLEPTNACNLKCNYCPREKADKGVGFLPWETYKRLIDEAARYPQLIMLNLHKDGESFLHPAFSGYGQICQENEGGQDHPCQYQRYVLVRKNYG